MPGQMSNVYNRFYRYSFGNQALLYMQGVREPVNTYQRWADMGRQVVKGSRAKYILRPMFRKEVDEATGIEYQRVSGFKPMNCLFGVSETVGDELPEYQPPEWSEERALGALAINRVAFTHLDGNIQGVSWERNVAINPVAAEPFPTLAHELSHVVMGHTVKEKLAEYATHRGLIEFEAEGSAYLVCNDLGVDEEHWNRSESRAYIAGWLHGKTPPDESIRRVFKATDAILTAGREPVAIYEGSSETETP